MVPRWTCSTRRPKPRPRRGPRRRRTNRSWTWKAPRRSSWPRCAPVYRRLHQRAGTHQNLARWRRPSMASPTISTIRSRRSRWSKRSSPRNARCSRTRPRPFSKRSIPCRWTWRSRSRPGCGTWRRGRRSSREGPRSPKSWRGAWRLNARRSRRTSTMPGQS